MSPRSPESAISVCGAPPGRCSHAWPPLSPICARPGCRELERCRIVLHILQVAGRVVWGCEGAGAEAAGDGDSVVGAELIRLSNTIWPVLSKSVGPLRNTTA